MITWLKSLWNKWFPKPPPSKTCVLCDGQIGEEVGILRYTTLNYEHEVEPNTIEICGVCAYLMREYEVKHEGH